MSNKKLNIDLSPLQKNPENKLIIRFNDINEQIKQIFATRIKKTATISTIKTKISIPTIYSILEEINPIIFAESNSINSYEHSFNTYLTKKLDKKRFNNICKTIYWLSKNKPIEQWQLRNIIYLTATSPSHVQLTEILNNYYPTQIINPPLNHSEIDISIIENARLNAETTNTQIEETLNN